MSWREVNLTSSTVIKILIEWHKKHRISVKSSFPIHYLFCLFFFNCIIIVLHLVSRPGSCKSRRGNGLFGTLSVETKGKHGAAGEADGSQENKPHRREKIKPGAVTRNQTAPSPRTPRLSSLLPVVYTAVWLGGLLVRIQSRCLIIWSSPFQYMED